MESPYAVPNPGASLLVSLQLVQREVIVIGGSTFAATRTFSALEAGSQVKVLLDDSASDHLCDELKWRSEHHQISVAHCSSAHDYLEDHLSPLVALVCVTDTLIGFQKRSRRSAQSIHDLCRSRNILVNVSDMPDLCSVTFPSTHRFNNDSPLQIAVATNGHGCRLGGRLRREIMAKLPSDVGKAVANVGKLRELAGRGDLVDDDVCDDESASTPNRPVPIRAETETVLETRRRRMKWVAQISEYWSLAKLASMSTQDMHDIIISSTSALPEMPLISSTHTSILQSPLPTAETKRGRILLVGSGPGHPSLLTTATHNALTNLADLVLSDKLVPEPVLSLIPSHVEVRIARKFPGNADGAQEELMKMGVEAAKQGRTVVRLKQGDPSVYGRLGEEILHFRANGFEPLIIPGVSSALSAPTLAGIPITQRGVAESFIVCSPVGRKGKRLSLPEYERSKTVVVLMGVARLGDVVKGLTCADEGGNGGMKVERQNYPLNTPIAIIERAAMPDQRIIESTLEHIEAALESVGEQRPPGLFVIGWAVLCLWKEGDVTVLDEEGDNEVCEKDRERVEKWLEGKRWRVREGVDRQWEDLSTPRSENQYVT
ncbi:uroporphyrin-III C-methyltransferase [Flagelloscypha sp. PMI_526]|nr:uroporphyrin-III C-methyltransferase [Flagelloscypha sp. PMI_526]